MKLNYKIQGQGPTILLLHGLFGNLDNLGIIARAFNHQYQIIQVDLRNHGLSPWFNEMNYTVMAEDIVELIQSLAVEELIIIGHSMGGKVAMRLTEMIPIRIKSLIILDIAPVIYTADSHSQVFKAINACTTYIQGQQVPNDRNTVQQVMIQYLSQSTIQFLLKSYKSDHWLFNFPVIEKHYSDILGWQDITPYYQPVLFIKGSHSEYINQEFHSDILNQFPYAVIETVESAGHNVHSEQPQTVIALIEQWINH